MIEVCNLSKRFGATMAVDGVSFTVEKGEILGLLGTNGAGKSTLMRVLTCYYPPTSGTASVAGFDVARSSLEVRRRVGYLPENAPIYPEMRVRSFLRYAAEIKGLTGRDRDMAAERAMADTGLTQVSGRLLGNLSRGYRQRAGLAQALVGAPDVLILDEPTTGLDPSQVVEARELIASLAVRQTVILSTHILPEVTATCGRVVIVHRGRVVAHGSPRCLHAEFRMARRVEARIADAPRREALELVRAIHGVEAVDAVDETEGTHETDGADGRTQGKERHAALRLSLRTDGAASVAPDLAAAVCAKGWRLLDLRESGDSLEDVFMQAISSPSET